MRARNHRLVGGKASLGWAAAVVFVLSLALGSLPSLAMAHLGTPFGDVLGPLLEAEVVVLVRTRAETVVEPAGARTEAEVTANLVGHAPRRLTMIQPPPHIHRLREGTSAVVPLRRIGPGRYRVLVETSTPLDGDPREVAALRRLLAAWRALPRPLPDSVRLRRALAHLEGSTMLERRLVLEQLLNATAEARRAMGPADDAALVDAVRKARLPEPYRLGLLRFAALSGRQAVLDGLCQRETDLSPALRGALFDAMSRSPSRCATDALAACAVRAGDPLAERCRTLAARRGP